MRDRYGRVTELLGADGHRAGTTTGLTAAAVATAHDHIGESGDWPAPAVAGSTAGRTLTAAVPHGLVDAPASERAASAADTTERRADADPVEDDTREAAAVVAVVVGELVDGATTAAALDTARTVALDRGAPVSVRETLAVVGDRAAVTIATAGPALALLETALHEAVVADGPEESTVASVSRGGEAAALGAVAGALAGARHGEADVPIRWRNGLGETAAVLRDLADALTEASPAERR